MVTSETERFAADDWRAEWQGMIDAIGSDFSDGRVRYGVDRIEPAAVRRYIEPLEWDCPLHYDADIARAFGHPDVIAPYSVLLSFTMPAMWSPGHDPIFEDADANAQPTRSPINNPRRGPAPATTGFFVTDMEIDFLRPVIVGERLGRRGNRLVACVPKETAVGRGAFSTWESEIVDENGDVVARLRNQTYAYDPRPKRRDADSDEGGR
jgi:acyl dehydratase